jgi:hypothetical protein
MGGGEERTNCPPERFPGEVHVLREILQLVEGKPLAPVLEADLEQEARLGHA